MVKPEEKAKFLPGRLTSEHMRALRAEGFGSILALSGFAIIAFTALATVGLFIVGFGAAVISATSVAYSMSRARAKGAEAEATRQPVAVVHMKRRNL